MKKILSIAVLAIMLVLISVSGVYATTSSELADTLYNIGAKYGMTSADKVKIERYLSENPVSNSEADAIVSKANSAANVMDNAGVKSYSKLTASQKSEIKTLVNEAASVAGVTVSFKTSSVEIYKDGKLIETVTSNNGKLAYTGNNVITLVVSSMAVIALAAGLVARKKLANA